MKLDYFSIGNIAREIGCRRDDLLALSPSNDPFYVHLPSRREAAEWFAELWVRLGWKTGSHLRRLHYTLISQTAPILKPNGEPYLNLENDWKLFVKASLGARYLRLIPDNALIDRRNPTPLINVSRGSPNPSPPGAAIVGCRSNLGRTISSTLELPDYLPVGFDVPQAYVVEVWSEKTTPNDVLVPLASQLGFNLVPGMGETSEMLARQAVERAIDDGRPRRILYVSDFDPAGRSMPVALARKIQFWLEDCGLDLDITLDPIVLTPEQCESFRLPRTPLKETERRGAKFEQRFGAGATELDALEALHPGVLKTIVSSEVYRYLDLTLQSQVRLVELGFERRIEAAFQQVMQKHDITELAKRLDVINDTVRELDDDVDKACQAIASDLEQNAPQFDPGDLPKPRAAKPPNAPLFDSKRDYLDQMDHYHHWQGRGARA